MSLSRDGRKTAQDPKRSGFNLLTNHVAMADDADVYPEVSVGITYFGYFLLPTGTESPHG